jgi:NitT/TauT family transport system substrate-binding protein
MKRFLTVALALGIACVSGTQSQADSPGSPVPSEYKGDGGALRMTVNPASTAEYAAYTIKKFKLDEKYGFDYQVIPVGNYQAAQNAVLAGAADLMVTDLVVLASLRKQNANVIAVVPMFRWGDAIMVPTDSPIKTICDFKGKRIGTDSIIAATWFIVEAAGKKLCNFDLQKVATIQAGGVVLLRGLIEQGNLDATYVSNNLAPPMEVTGKYRVLYQMRDLITAIGLDGDVPLLFQSVSLPYAAAHPADVRAYLAAYRDAVQILNTNDDIWVEVGVGQQKMAEAAVPALRDEMRRDLMSKFEPDTEDAVRNLFKVLVGTAGSEALAMTELPPVFMTTQYQ